MKRLLLLLLMLIGQIAVAQKIDPDLLHIKQRMDSISQFTATMTLNLDVPFIKMPPKTAKVSYAKGKKMVFSSKDFVMLPKRGLDFSLDEIFKYPFITVDRGTEKLNGKTVKVINVIPTDKKSDYVLVTLYMDKVARRIAKSEINTRTEGTYTLLMQYAAAKDALPHYVEAAFAVEKLNIPLNFMGKDTKIDQKQMRSSGTKTGKIKMKIAHYVIKR